MNKKAILPPHFFRGKKTQKIFVSTLIFLIVFSIGTIFINNVNAGIIPIYIDSSESTYSDAVYTEHETTSVYRSAIGSCFIASDTAYLSSVTYNEIIHWYIEEDSELLCMLMTVAGNVTEETAYPDTFVELSSTTINYAYGRFGTSELFTFLFAGTNQLISGNQYAIILFKLGGKGLIDTDYFKMRSADSEKTTVQGIEYKSNGWNAISRRPAMNVYGSEEPLSEPTPTPSSTPLPIEEWESRKKSVTFIDGDNGEIFWSPDVNQTAHYESGTYPAETYDIPYWTHIIVGAEFEEGYTFHHFSIYYETTEEIIELYFMPIRLLITDDMQITLYTESGTLSPVSVTVNSCIGGYIELRLLNQTDYTEMYDSQFLTYFRGAGTYYFSGGVIFNIYGVPYTGYEFNRFTITETNLATGVTLTTSYTSNPLQYIVPYATVTINAYFTQTDTDTTIPTTDGVVPLIVLINNFFFGDTGVLGAGFGLIIMMIICVLLLMLAGKSLEVLIIGVVVSTIINVAVGIWELWTIILIIIAIVAVALKNTGYLGSGNNGE